MPEKPGNPGFKGPLLMLIDKVICQKGGADVVFAPGLFDESWGGDGPVGEGGVARHTYQTTCIGISTQR